MKKILLIAAAVLLLASAAGAQDTENKFKVTPTGRLLLDGAAYISPDKDGAAIQFHNGVGIPDVRLGAKMSYGKWSAKVDIAYSMGKIGIKDLFMQYSFSPELSVKAGNFICQYGLQPPVSSSLKCTFEEPLSNASLNIARQVGVQVQYSHGQYLGALAAHSNAKAINTTPNDANGQGFGFTTRQVWRPYVKDGAVVQVGISGAAVLPQGSGAGKNFSFGGNFPTRVDAVTAVSTTITNAANQFKFTPELLLAYKRVALEAQYFFNRVNMQSYTAPDGMETKLHNWTGQGAYATVRGLLMGSGYTYDSGNGVLNTPAPKSLELALGYNYTSLSDKKAQYVASDGTIGTGIYGGRVNQASATLSYYINKYFIVRLNYTYTHRWDATALPRTDLGVVQARVQVIF